MSVPSIVPKYFDSASTSLPYIVKVSTQSIIIIFNEKEVDVYKSFFIFM